MPTDPTMKIPLNEAPQLPEPGSTLQAIRARNAPRPAAPPAPVIPSEIVTAWRKSLRWSRWRDMTIVAAAVWWLAEQVGPPVWRALGG